MILIKIKSRNKGTTRGSITFSMYRPCNFLTHVCASVEMFVCQNVILCGKLDLALKIDSS